MVCVGSGKEAVTENEAVLSSPGVREVGGGMQQEFMQQRERPTSKVCALMICTS